MECITEEDGSTIQPMPVFSFWLLGGAVTASLLALLFMRALHYWGRHPRSTDPPHIRRIKWCWWASIAIGSWFPLFGSACLAADRDPLKTVSMNSAVVIVLCIVESVFTHYLQEYMRPGDDVRLLLERQTQVPAQTQTQTTNSRPDASVTNSAGDEADLSRPLITPIESVQ